MNCYNQKILHPFTTKRKSFYHAPAKYWVLFWAFAALQIQKSKVFHVQLRIHLYILAPTMNSPLQLRIEQLCAFDAKNPSLRTNKSCL